MGVKEIWSDGELKLIAVDGPNDDKVIELRPDAGNKWRVIYAYGYHNDSSSRSSYWQVYDGTITVAMDANSVAANINVPINRNTATTAEQIFAESLILTRSIYAQFQVTALTAGDNVFIRAIVIEITGV